MAPLGLLATIYGRQGKLLLAEGFLRRAVSCMHIDSLGQDDQTSKSSHDEDGSQTHGKQTDTGVMNRTEGRDRGVCSVSALVAWRLGQILSLIPHRETEADRWLALGRSLWPFGHGMDIEERLGDRMMFHASGKKGFGSTVSATLGTLFCGRKPTGD
jgi:hypothetical protein